jgi:hypothetical protein
METQKLIFDAYVSSVRRVRWFLLATLILSGVLILHTYLEQFSFSDKQLMQTLANRLEKNPKKEVEELEKDLSASGATGKSDYSERLAKYAQMKFVLTQTDNTLASLKLENRNIPFIGISVSANDFLPAVCLMQTLFMFGLWAAFRAIKGPLRMLDLSQNDMKNLVRAHFLFVSDPEAKEQKLGRALLHGAILFPFAAFTIAMAFDAYPVFVHLFVDKTFVVGTVGMLLTRYLFLVLLLLLTAVMSVVCSANARATMELL